MPARPVTGPEDAAGRHLVVHCGTGELFSCDTLEEAHALAAEHAGEAAPTTTRPAPPVLAPTQEDNPT